MTEGKVGLALLGISEGVQAKRKGEACTEGTILNNQGGKRERHLGIDSLVTGFGGKSI